MAHLAANFRQCTADLTCMVGYDLCKQGGACEAHSWFSCCVAAAAKKMSDWSASAEPEVR